MINTTYNLDLTPGGIPLVVHASQYDANSRFLVFNLLERDGAADLPNVVRAAIRGTKPDGNGFDYEAVYAAATEIGPPSVTVLVTEQMTAMAGRVVCEIYLFTGTPATTEHEASPDFQQLGSANFILSVERSALDKDTLLSDSEIRQLVDVIDRTDEILAAAATSDAAMVEIQTLTWQTQAAQREAALSAEEASGSAESAAASATDAAATLRSAQVVISSAKDAAIADAREEISRLQGVAEDAISNGIDAVNTRAQQIVEITTSAEDLATQALSTANNADNHMATLDSQIQAIEAAMQDVSIDVDDLGLEQDPDTFYVYPTYKGVRSENGIPLAGGGGGGGGSADIISAVFTATSTTGWLSKTIATGTPVPVSFTWSSIEDNMPTGDGAIRIMVNDIVRATMQISQGDVTIDLAPYLSAGTNKVKVRISDTYDQGKTTTFNIMSIALSISSTFSTATPYSSAISFPYTPVGAVAKNVYFILDGQQIGTQETLVSGRQMSFTIPAQSHGGHTLRVYFEAEINGETVRSNELYYEFIYAVPMNDSVIITSSFSESTQPQYSSIAIPYQVYDPAALTAEVKIYANNVLLSTQTVDRTEHSYTYRANTAGSLVIEFKSGNATKAINITVTESAIDVDAETENLVLHLSSQGRSNHEAHPEVWQDTENHISTALSNFNFTSDGWQADSDGITCLRVSGAARVTVPYKIFQTDFRSTGKTIEVEFATRNVLDYDATILSCWSGNRGIKITAQNALLKSEQSEIATQYKEDEHIRVTFVAEKTAENRFLLTYIDGIPSGIVQYPPDDDFSQVTPVNISIGSSDCTIDLYCIRIYDNGLTRHQVLDNWIADTQDGALMLDRYTRNAVYDAYGKIEIASLPADLPYFILSCPELPQYKGDKKMIEGQYVNRMLPSKSFTFTGCQINVQGTSSAPYARKNYDMQFKEGFEMATGHADNYQLQAGNVPFNRFVLKADVASSEGANNVELVRLYNDACPYKTPEMISDSRVRWGIDGFPIVVFWHDTQTGETSFLGKYNFNLPKRAPGPYGYADDDTMESWEFQNNTSNLMLFKTDYFSEAMYTDPDTGDTKELWRYDYEARFPSDEWTDYSNLQELQSFIYSTYREEATGDTLEEAVTYGDMTYTADTAEYRLAKFKAEFPTYAELSSFLFYYIFTEWLLMVDSRAKNLFIGFNGSPVTVPGRHAARKATAQPYDMDTAIGTNNEGSLVFSYNLEDTDHLTGGANIFNGQDSVLWCNLRDAFDTEIRQMAQSLRSAGTLSYATLESRYEAHQAKWPEAVWIEDSWFKYIDPLINPDPGKEPTAVYLPMMQGSKEQQRKWWLLNRFKYMDSKWNAGDALSQVIQLRGYAKADITVTPYTDIYPTIKYASYVVQERGSHGTPTTLACPLSTVNDTEIYIYSAPQIASVGDLSPLKVGFADFSMATRLQNIKIGDADPEYENQNLTALTLGNNILLKTLDVRNCSALGTGDQKSVDISGCEIIEEVYFDGTVIQGLTLPNGGVLKTLRLPGTITNLTVLNQPGITDFKVTDDDYSKITTLRIENSGGIPILDILSAIAPYSRVRLIGLSMTVSGTSEVEEFYNLLDTMRGLDENGNNTAHAVVQGTISGLGTITGAWLAAMQERYPYITIQYEHVSSQLKYYNGDTLYYTETITDGGNGVYSGTPTKASTAQYSYSFAGWSKTNDNTVDSDARTAVTADRNCYACYTNTVRKYTATFVRAAADGGGTLYTQTNVQYGTKPTYSGATPTTTKGNATDFPFEGWTPALTGITGNTTYTAKFGSPVEVAEITDTWDVILASIDDGTYKSRYKVGHYKSLDLGSYGTVTVQIAAIDKDVDKYGNDVPLTFITKQVVTTQRFGSWIYNTTDQENWTELTTFRANLVSVCESLMPAAIFNRIAPVQKITCGYESGTYNNNIPSVDKIWIPSYGEITGYSSGVWFERSGVTYRTLYDSIGEPNCHTRSAFSSRGQHVYISGGRWNNTSSAAGNYLLGFCLGSVYQGRYTGVSLASAMEEPDFRSAYSVGDIFDFDLGTEGNVCAQLVAYDYDDKSDGTGKADATFLTWYAMDNQYAVGGASYPTSTLHNTLNTTIKGKMPAAVSSKIVEVSKVWNSTGLVDGDATYSDSVWLVGREKALSESINGTCRRTTRDGTHAFGCVSRDVYASDYYSNFYGGTYTRASAEAYIIFGFSIDL